MKLNALLAAAVLAATGVQASAAAITSQSFDDVSSTFFFDAKRIGAADATTYNFVLDLGGGEAGQSYTIQGDISATNFSFSSVLLNGTPWQLQPTAGGTYLGLVSATASGPLEVEVTGTFTGPTNGYGNFQGSLVLAAVPEPETYALMLAGLAAVGFVARRRKH